MTDPKIPAPEPCAWADGNAARGLVGAVESAEVRKNWQRTLPVCASRLTHPLITLESAETWAAAREAAARERLVKEWNNLPDELREHPGLGGLFAAIQKA